MAAYQSIRTAVCDQTIRLNHLSDLPMYETEQPYELVLPNLPPHVKQTNLQLTSHEVTLQDIRKQEAEFGLETTGFLAIQHVSNCLPSFDELDKGDAAAFTVAGPYLEETRSLVKEKMQAEKVVVTNWIVLRDLTLESEGTG